jgi:hypothetical protein
MKKLGKNYFVKWNSCIGISSEEVMKLPFLKILPLEGRLYYIITY